MIKESDLKKLCFYFIEEIYDGLYVKKWAKNCYDFGTKVDVLEDSVCFYDKSNSDHRRKVNFKDILWHR